MTEASAAVAVKSGVPSQRQAKKASCSLHMKHQHRRCIWLCSQSVRSGIIAAQQLHVAKYVHRLSPCPLSGHSVLTANVLMAPTAQTGRARNTALHYVVCVAASISILISIFVCVILLVVGMQWPPSGLPHKLPAPRRPAKGPFPGQILPGFGFDLGPSSIAASIRHPNGTFDDYVFPNISGTYQQYFRESSLGPPRCDEDWSKGRPQEPHDHDQAIEIFVSVLEKVRDSIHEITGLHVDKAMVSHPRLPVLCYEDLEAALDALDIGVIWNSRVSHQPGELTSAYAAYGRGLCSNYTRRNPCEYEERWELPLRTIMVATYTDEALLIEHGQLTYAVGRVSQADSLIDWEAGANALRGPTEPWLHWNRVRARLLEVPVHWRHVIPETDVVILAGEYARNETFVEVVKDTFAKFQDEPPELLMDLGPTTGARGAAELAFRSQYQH